jgi:hypothetical protein
VCVSFQSTIALTHTTSLNRYKTQHVIGTPWARGNGVLGKRQSDSAGIAAASKYLAYSI